jgi:hypothetical protein
MALLQNPDKAQSDVIRVEQSIPASFQVPGNIHFSFWGGRNDGNTTKFYVQEQISAESAALDII